MNEDTVILTNIVFLLVILGLMFAGSPFAFMAIFIFILYSMLFNTADFFGLDNK